MGATRRHVVTCFLQHGGRVLLLKRSTAVRTHQGKWAGVSGTVEAETPLAQALQEIREETALGEEDVRILRRGEPLSILDSENDTEWIVHPFLFEVGNPSLVRLNWENTQSRWAHPSEIRELDTVPKLSETYDRLWKT